jgi:hypothetical protein
VTINLTCIVSLLGITPRTVTTFVAVPLSGANRAMDSTCISDTCLFW